MFEFIKLFVSFMPLSVQSVTWEKDSLTIFGHDWMFNTGGAWRLSEGSDLLFACWDNGADERVKLLEGLSIVDFSWLSGNQPIDPSFFSLMDGG